RERTPTPRDRAEELPPRPPDHLRQGRALPAALKKWLRAHPAQPATITELQTLLEAFVAYYNHQRPHRSLAHRATPAAAYTSRPKTAPSTDRSTETHDRVRTDRIDKSGVVTLRHNGRLHHIG